MSKVMKQIPFGRLMDWALTEYAQSGSIFGVNKLYQKTGDKCLEIFGEKLEIPFGPAAGPHTQVTQNIIASYVAGARFFELKTVQTLDGEDLPVSKPCISAQDECYNVEWSTELYVHQAMDEYIKGWYALKLLSRELELGDIDGFVFNMSVGYDLEGIKSKKIDDYIEGLRYAESTDTWQTCMQWALENLHRFKLVDKAYIDGISPEICRSITISTLHGCPPDEIERIASYLLTEKKLHTFVKCNPTLLGYEYARKTLDALGFDYIAFDDHHFKADLQFGDAVPMFRRLQDMADSLSLSFGVKLTNTFPVQITAGELPGGEMYMSGRSLFPLTVEVANRLTAAFEGKLRISYSGGADARNIDKLFDAGIWPITLATTLLKPGGYQRMSQIAGVLTDKEYKPFSGVDCRKIQEIVDNAALDPMYRKPIGIQPERKMKAAVPLIDCYTAPCRDGCPISQDVPAYLRLTGKGEYLEALRVITERNPLPFITGSICSQFCADKCTRAFYEGAVCIRDVKHEAAVNAFDALLAEIRKAPKAGKIAMAGSSERIDNAPIAGELAMTGGSEEINNAGNSCGKIAIIGGGPAGLSAAYFLARAGRDVTVFEKRDSPGGVVRHVIPEFRISGSAIDNDIELIKATGVNIRRNHEVGSIADLYAEGYETIIVATGAWKPGSFRLKSGEHIDAVEFLEQLKRDPQSVDPGECVVVIGGGNTAMDAARAAKRVAGVKSVSIVYRRTRRYMPADSEELELAMEDGVEFRELLAPISLHDGMLECEQMELGAPDLSGRRSPVSTGILVQIPANTVISAVGNHADRSLIETAGALEAKPHNLYVIGDAADGPATVVEAIADAMHCAKAITGVNMECFSALNINPDPKPAADKKGVLRCDGCTLSEPERCLECATLCRCCVDVCPNRANIAVMSDGRQQILHIDSMCNECGNCETFCPYSSAPYKDKLTLFANNDDFEKSDNPGFVPLENGMVRVRLDGHVSDYNNGEGLPVDIRSLIGTVLEISY